MSSSPVAVVGPGFGDVPHAIDRRRTLEEGEIGPGRDGRGDARRGVGVRGRRGGGGLGGGPAAEQRHRRIRVGRGGEGGGRRRRFRRRRDDDDNDGDDGILLILPPSRRRRPLLRGTANGVRALARVGQLEAKGQARDTMPPQRRGWYPPALSPGGAEGGGRRTCVLRIGSATRAPHRAAGAAVSGPSRSDVGLVASILRFGTVGGKFGTVRRNFSVRPEAASIAD